MKSIDHDIALIELNVPFEFNNHVQPICLPPIGEALSTGEKVLIMGWGLTTSWWKIDFDLGTPLFEQ